jgi:hypothetical protein
MTLTTGRSVTPRTSPRNFSARDGEPRASTITTPSEVTMAEALEMNPWFSVAIPAAPSA